MVDNNSKIDTQNLTPEECTKVGLWEIDPLYYTHAKTNASGNNGGHSEQRPRPLHRGKAYRCRETGDYVCFEDHDGVVYRIGDNVFLESQQAELPYFICGIQGFKMTKREQLLIKVSWYYRHTEVPETVYHSLVQDRHSEHSQQQAASESSSSPDCSQLYIKDPAIRCRELFISDAQDVYPVSTLRGKCVIRHYKDISALRDFEPLLDTFFYILGYNPENNRLASIQGEIRVGSAHQAKLPEYRGDNVDWSSISDDEREDGEPPREVLQWQPGRIDETSMQGYLSASRTLGAFDVIYNSSSTDDGITFAVKDDTKSDAHNALHDCDYDTGKAMHALIERRQLKSASERLLLEEETKKFCKGMKQWGKNFFKIRKELFPHKTTSQLIDFYYLWKKSPLANSQRPRQRQRRPPTTILRRIKTANAALNSSSAAAKSSRPASSEFLDFSSASENEMDESDSETRDLSGYACHHCYHTASKDWHHAGRDRALLCTDCRLYFKKYGELRNVNRPSTPPPYLFRSMANHESEFTNAAVTDDFGVRTRAGKANKDVNINRRRTMTPTAEMECGGRKSPSAASTSSASSLNSVDPDIRKASRKSSMPLSASKQRGRKHIRKGTGDDSRLPPAKRIKNGSSPPKSDDSDTTHAPSSDSAPVSPKDTDNNMVVDVKPPMVRLSPRKSASSASVYDFRDEDIKRATDASNKQQNRLQIDQPMPLLDRAEPIGLPSSVIIPPNSAAIKSEVNDESMPTINEHEQPPRLDDTEVYRSNEGQATFIRHWHRGDENSCARTDLEFRAKVGCAWDRRSTDPHHQHNRKSTSTRSTPLVVKQEYAVQQESSTTMHTSPNTRIMPTTSQQQQPMTTMFNPMMFNQLPPQFLAAGFPNLPSAFANEPYASRLLRQYVDQAGAANNAAAMAMQQAMMMGEMNHQRMMQEQQFAAAAAAADHHQRKQMEHHMREQQQQQQQQQQQHHRQHPHHHHHFGGKEFEMPNKGQQSAPPPPTPTPQPVPTTGDIRMQQQQLLEHQHRLAAAAVAAQQQQQLPPGFAFGPEQMMMLGLGFNPDSRMLLENQMFRMQMEAAAASAAAVSLAAPTAQHHTHAHTHSHTHLHLHPSVSTANAAPLAGSHEALLHQQMNAMNAATAGGRASLLGMPPPPPPPPTFGAGPNFMDPAMIAMLQQNPALFGFPPGSLPPELMQERMREDPFRRLIDPRMLPQHSSEMMRRLQQEGGGLSGFGPIRPP